MNPRFWRVFAVALACAAVIAACGDNGNSTFPTGIPDAGLGDDTTTTPPPGFGGDASNDGSGACTPSTCAKLGINCGPAGDGCGGLLQCGTCTAPETCGGGGKSSVCGGNSGCVPKTCAGLGTNCGPVADGCGGLLQCGTCTAPNTCGGGGKPSVCGGASNCAPKTCSQLGVGCGPAGDGCGGLLQCGACTAPDSCGGGGKPSQCGVTVPDGGNVCTPTTCAAQGLTCGPAGDGCGAQLNCGTCVAPQSCGGGGTPSQCGGNAVCVPKACAQLGIACGPAGDGCGGLLQCGTCTSPNSCGGGGMPGQCGYTVPDGGNQCTPTTCAALGLNCGPAGDGCGGTLNCGTCVAPQTCGGGGTPSVCGGMAGCVPATCASLGINCGPAGDGCGGTLNCGTCVAPQTCGGGGTPSVCGGNNNCVPKTCAQQGYNCGPEGDGCGGLIPSCGTCTAPNICGGGGVPGVCGDSNLDAGCTGLCKQQVQCDGGGTTTISGTVYAPTDSTKGYGNPDPLYDALVYVPNGTVQPFPTGVSCDVCGAATGNPLVSFTTGPNGQFTLTNAPCGTNIPLVIQLGRWRRQIVIPAVSCCVNNALTPDQTRLPRNKAEGDIPLFAISTGNADPIECVLPKIGIDLAEFTNPSGNGRVRLYKDNGAQINGATPAASTLYGSQAELDKYDLVIFDCVGGEQTKSAANQTNVINYANLGGRVFASHFSYVWLFNDAPFSSTANWGINQAAPPDPLKAYIDTSFQKGSDFALWLGVVGALNTVSPPSILVNQSRRDTNGAIVPPSQRFLWGDPTANPVPSDLEFTFNTPVNVPDGGTQCGRVLFSDFHVNTGGAGSGTFPGECPVAPMTPQEKVLEFMLFDLSSCIQNQPPPPPMCTPLTCGQQGFNCGPAGDGCGNQLNCGTCSGCQTCGGGGMGSVCGGSCCAPLTCAQQGKNCGPAGDGCGGSLNCGNCPAGQTCGGGGMPGVCGAPSCTPETCAQQNINCGPAGDGCGGLLACGVCMNPLTCGGGGKPGQCGLGDAGACMPETCAQQGISCGPAGDGCGGQLDCGTCPAGQTCGGGGKPGVCGAPNCTPETCAAQGILCGPAGDGCGGALDCGSCTMPETCGGGGKPGTCGVGDAGPCVPLTCAGQGIQCGPAGDGCGGSLDCGPCMMPQTCGGGGQGGKCGGCVPETCAQQGLNCGPAGDGCGGALNCGPCPMGQTCGGGGKPGVCGSPMCTPKTCAQLGYNCGPAGDGCGGLLSCGTCTGTQTCGGGGTPGVCGGGTK